MSARASGAHGGAMRWCTCGVRRPARRRAFGRSRAGGRACGGRRSIHAHDTHGAHDLLVRDRLTRRSVAARRRRRGPCKSALPVRPASAATGWSVARGRRALRGRARADGSLTGFGGGLHVKRALLELEGAACVADLFSGATVSGAPAEAPPPAGAATAADPLR